jgi:hypothetical protein
LVGTLPLNEFSFRYNSLKLDRRKIVPFKALDCRFKYCSVEI